MNVERNSLTSVLAADRSRINAVLETTLARHRGRIGLAAAHLARAGGKRTRPLLSCVVMRALGRDPAAHLEAIVASELIHTASLLHDDLVDEAETRRGVRVVHLAFDPKTAVMAGDLLMTQALGELARAGHMALVRAATGAVSSMARGQVMESEQRYDVTVRKERLLRVNRLKTASLIGFAAEVGARLAGTDGNVRRAATRFGVLLGEAFQLVDDLLDWTGDPAVTGKPRGQDLCEGKVTVPLHLGMSRDQGLADEVRILWKTASPAAGAVSRFLPTLRRCGALDATGTLANTMVCGALESLNELPRSPWTEQLATLAQSSLSRAA